MQKIIAKIYNGKEVIANSKIKKNMFCLFAVVLPWTYYLIINVWLFISNFHEKADLSIDLTNCFIGEWIVYIISPFGVMPFYVALAFFATVIFWKNLPTKILMGFLYVLALLIQTLSIFGMTYVYEIWYLAGPHLIILLVGVLLAIKLKLYEKNKNYS